LPATGVYTSVMACKKWILRFLRVAGLAALAVVLLTFVAVQFQQRLLRWRAERLMADMHQIRLYQSTWADAQKLMYRWGAWGHYDGSCMALDCRYVIEIGDPTFGINAQSEINWMTRNLYFVRSSGLFGGHIAALRTTFTVQDGVILRESAEVVLDVPADLRHFREWNSTYSLIVETKSRQRLLHSNGVDWVLGSYGQLADHPYYKVGTPSGCENCFAAVVTYSTYTPQSEIDRLTDFDFSCFTQFGKCQWLGDLLPIAWEWRLYSFFEPGHTRQMDVPEPQRPCDIPLWALGRDYNTVFAVKALSTGQQKGWNGPHEIDRVKIISTLKGSAWRNGLTLNASPYPDNLNDPDMAIRERLTPGKSYLLIYEDQFDDPPGLWLTLDRCGVQEDTPEVRRELEKGFAQNDNLRGPELR
jgi:hypothetical protein